MQELKLPTWVVQTLTRILAPSFYGKVTLHIKNGDITVVRVEQTYVEGNEPDQ